MTVLVRPTARNTVTRSTVVALSCDVCGNELHVTSADCRLPMMTARVAIAHEAACPGARRPVERSICGQEVRPGWVCVSDPHEGDSHYVRRVA